MPARGLACIAVLLVLMTTQPAAAYQGGAHHSDYLAELTEDDLRLALRDKGVIAPTDATRRTLVRLIREVEAKDAPAATPPPSVRSGITTVKVLYCMG